MQRRREESFPGSEQALRIWARSPRDTTVQRSRALPVAAAVSNLLGPAQLVPAAPPVLCRDFEEVRAPVVPVGLNSNAERTLARSIYS